MIDFMTLMGSAVAALAANALVSYIKGRLKRDDRVVWDVSVASGKRETISIPTSEHSDVESAVQQLILKAMATIYREPSEQSAEKLRTLISNLEQFRLAMPLSRQLNIVLSNAYRHLGDLPSAIKILSDYISRKSVAEQYDRDLADAYYNRACFNALSDNMELALADIKKSLELRPENIVVALNDPDLEALKGTLAAMRPPNSNDQRG